jgi:spermidine synthase
MLQFSKLYVTMIALFVLSGLASLVYQVVWFKQLAYFLGNTTYSQSIVLATFMGGLALGAWYWGKVSDRINNNLKLFAYLEIILALYCFMYYPIFDFAADVFTGLVHLMEWESDSYQVLLLKFLVSSLTILFPTFLMGGTLPVLVRFISNQSDKIGENVAILYFVNSLGAVLGTVLAGFFLLQWLGLRMTTFAGASVELFVGMSALILSKYFEKDIVAGSAKNAEVGGENKGIVDSEFSIAKNTILWFAGITGFCAMVYEVGWLRLLIPILSSSTYSFTIILTVFIGGITLGSYLVYKFQSRIKKPLFFVGFCQFAIVISILISLPFYERIPFLIWKTVQSSEQSELTYALYLATQMSFVFILLIVPTVFMGMSLPVLSRIAVNEIHSAGRTIGSIFAVNTLGTVIGSLTAGLILIPIIGIRSTVELAMLLNALIAFRVFFWKSLTQRKLKIRLVALFVIATLFYSLNVNSNRWAHAIMISEIPRQINRIAPPSDFQGFIEGSLKSDTILFYKEGIGGTIVVATNGKEVYLTTNGKGDANSVTDLRTQISLGLTPITLHPKPDSIFVIGFGAGTTIGHAASHPNVKYAEVAEISPEVIEASVFFNSINNKPLENKKIRIIKDDGISALRLSNKKFDVIISQPSNPWSAGVGNLFTDEFFRDCKTKLKPGGIVGQWFNLYEMDDQSLALILRTALGRFEHVSLWHIGKLDVLLICSDKKIDDNLDRMKKSWDLGIASFQQASIFSFAAFLSQQLSNRMESIRNYAGKGVVNAENHPYLELWAPRAFFYNYRPEKFIDLDERSDFGNAHLLLNKYLKENKPSDDDILQAGLFQSTGGSKELAFYLADLNPEIYLAWSQKVAMAGDEVQANEYMNLYLKASEKKAKMTSFNGGNTSEQSIFAKNPHQTTATMYAEQGKFDLALKEIEKAIQMDSKNSEFYYQKGTFHLALKQLEEAKQELEKSISLNAKFVDAYNNLATVKGMMGDYKGVVDLLNKAEKLDGANPKIYYNRGYAKGFLNDFGGAYKDFTKCIELMPTHGQAYLFRGHALLSMNRRAEACADFRKALSLNVQGAAESIKQSCN